MVFKRKSVPENDGNSGIGEIERLQYTKSFEIELSNMEETPVYSLTHQLSIGSEIGNIIIADPSISPRHATFILQQDVVSIMDHGSVTGTFVNDTQIPAGKYIILEETDVVKVGDLEMRLKVSTKATPVPEIAAPPIPEVKEEARPQKTQAKKPLKVVPTLAANSIVRVFAIIGDFLLAYSILVIFSPFDEFRQSLDFVPDTLATLLDIKPDVLIETLLRDAGFAGDMIKDGISFLSSTFTFGPILIVFVFLRLFSTFLFGVSASEFLVGVRATGNAIWARVGGVIRVVIGLFTGPLIIFDIPAIISRRTLKELLTFTKITVPSKLLATSGILFGIPLLLGLALVSPLIQGLESPAPIVINEKVDQRVKAEVPPNEALVKDVSETLQLDLSYDPKELLIIPSFKFQGVSAKLKLMSSLTFYHRGLRRPVELEVFKNFDLRQLLGIGIKGNVPLYEKYPEIYNFVYEAMDSNPAFKLKKDEQSQLTFASEFIKFTKSAFAIEPQNALDLMQSESFLIKGLVDYKSSFLSLLEYKDFNEIGFIKIGNLVFMRVRYLKQKPFDLIIPLIKGDGRILKVTFDEREKLQDISTQFYKFSLSESDWITTNKTDNKETLSPLSVFDFFHSGKFREQPLSGEVAQAIYGYYFETSGALISRGERGEIEIWKTKVRNLPKLIDAIPGHLTQDGFDPKFKLKQNMQDLIDALENNNTEYFGVPQTTTL